MEPDERAAARRGGVAPAPFGRANDWLVLGVVGLLVFLVGIYMPATAWLGGPRSFGTDWIAVAIAVIGGAVAGVGFSKYYDERPGGPAARRRPPGRIDMGRASNLSSFEVYRPDVGRDRRNTKP